MEERAIGKTSGAPGRSRDEAAAPDDTAARARAPAGPWPVEAPLARAEARFEGLADGAPEPGPRDVVVVGGSAGGFQALAELLGALPEGFPAAILVALHASPDHRGTLPKALVRASALPVRRAREAMPIEPGTVTLAPPDAHLLVGARHVHLRRGPRENGFRPAIDPLFRSAAVYHGSRALGVVLSGMLDDGAAGARALDRVGARVLVQSPDSADFDAMPRAAAALVPHAEALDPEAIGARLARLAGPDPAVPVPDPVPAPLDVRLELQVATLENATMATEHRLGSLTPFNCPDCSGVLWRIDEGGSTRFRCHTGHAYTRRALDEVQERALERTLFEALRAHRGRAELLRHMAERARGPGERATLEERCVSYEADAETLESLIRRREG